jgi:aspartate racemase
MTPAAATRPSAGPRVAPSPSTAASTGTAPKMIGLLGGMSWPSTITYYGELNRQVQARLGGSHSARVLLWSGDYHTVEQLQLAGEWAAAGKLLREAARAIENAGADLVAIACNTMHRVAPAVRASISVPFVDLIDSTADHAGRLGVARAAVLGTRITMAMPEYSARLAEHGVEPMLPEPADRALLDRVVYDELCVGKVDHRTRETVASVVSRLVDRGADAVVLACTELGLVIDEPTMMGATVIDSAAVHVRALVDASLGREEPEHRYEQFVEGRIEGESERRE